MRPGPRLAALAPTLCLLACGATPVTVADAGDAAQNPVDAHQHHATDAPAPADAGGGHMHHAGVDAGADEAPPLEASVPEASVIEASVADVATRPPSDLSVQLAGFEARLADRTELRLAAPDGSLAAVAVLDGITTATERFSLTEVAPSPGYRLSFFVDADRDGRH